MPKILDTIVVEGNPLDAMARSAFGIPKTAKGLLATHLDPRPAGIVMRNRTAPLNKRPSELMTDDEWAKEIRHNNGNYIAVLLRHPAFAADSEFVELFESVEIEYRAALKRSKWAFFRRPSNIHTEAVFERLRPQLEALIDAFVSWSLHNRRRIITALHEIETEEQYQTGNALNDLTRTGMDW